MTQMMNVKLATRSARAIHLNDGRDRPACGADGQHGHVPSVTTDKAATCKRCAVAVTNVATAPEESAVIVAYTVKVYNYTVDVRGTVESATKLAHLLITLNPSAPVTVQDSNGEWVNVSFMDLSEPFDLLANITLTETCTEARKESAVIYPQGDFKPVFFDSLDDAVKYATNADIIDSCTIYSIDENDNETRYIRN